VRDGTAPLGTQVRALLEEAARTAENRSLRQAEPVLSRVLRLASREHLRRPFQERDESLRPLLTAHPGLAREHSWLHHARTRTGPDRPPESDAEMPALVEPLTSKELEVLEHLAELLTSGEIAEAMFVSVNGAGTSHCPWGA
jgi:LuxR family maltose regulon positive regulatory protein